MTVWPKVIYLFQSIPLNCPSRFFFISLNKLITSFRWSQKRARIKLSSLQAPLNKGGLNLPNIRLYYLASQSRNIWCWLNRTFKLIGSQNTLYLREKFDMPPDKFCKFLQIRNWVKMKTPSFTNIAETSIEKMFRTTSTQKGLISKLYAQLVEM
uniref:Uncharacterized protein n=1 Tax=Labrus bergylta TaxID=56723 RepID=A0A3Q3FAY3_9LABR